MAAYEARQKEYAMRGQKHFYFMRLNSNEVFFLSAFYLVNYELLSRKSVCCIL